MYKIRLVMLAAGSSIALATAALAGPTGSTTTTIPGGSTTTTTIPGGSTTTTTTTTTTTSTTATTTSSTTTTTLPSGDGDLSGQYPFVDEKSGSANTSFLNVDTTLEQVCLAGQVQVFDRTIFPNRSVTYTYDTVGSISKATDKKVKADSSSATLELEIATVEDDPVVLYPPQSITVECKVKASLLKEGTKDKVNLRCDVGENFSDFPGLTPALLENIENARLKRLKVNTKKGKLKISTAGVPTDSGVPVSCDFPPPTTTTTTVPGTTTTSSTTVPGTTTTGAGTTTTVAGTTTTVAGTTTTVAGTTTTVAGTTTTVAGTTTTSMQGS